MGRFKLYTIDELEAQEEKEKPLLQAWRTGRDNEVKVWCPYCSNYHYHSMPDARYGDVEHRAAHCGKARPFKEGGYYIMLMRKGKCD